MAGLISVSIDLIFRLGMLLFLVLFVVVEIISTLLEPVLTLRSAAVSLVLHFVLLLDL